MNEVAAKYPLDNQFTVSHAWQRYQLADRNAYPTFLDFYEKNYKSL